ncbi:DUF2283 domain-containing protein [Actinomadura atramentaria]|uniref:DUF2283 domain-containing protein n=1 Tax=Actinomadura atramentaria TaxID=1990 RepID=UPI0009FECC4D|nr:DUF2283 domain-containing protein [Actinomadura atramentaria]
MADVKVTYDPKANAAYVYLASPEAGHRVARMYACDPVEVGGMINLDLDESGRLIGIEVLHASSKLPRRLLEAAERPNVGNE